MSDEKMYGGRVLPLWAFTHPKMSLTNKVLLAMSTLADPEGYCNVGIRTLSALVGELTEADKKKGKEAVEKKTRKVQNARQALLSAGYIEAGHYVSDEGYQKYRYKVHPQPVSEDVLAVWNRIGKRSGVTYTAPTLEATSSEVMVDVASLFAHIDLDDLIAESGEPVRETLPEAAGAVGKVDPSPDTLGAVGALEAPPQPVDRAYLDEVYQDAFSDTPRKKEEAPPVRRGAPEDENVDDLLAFFEE